MASMAEQIFKAGPSLMAMADIRWSAFSSIKAWPSISCKKNFELRFFGSKMQLEFQTELFLILSAST